MSRARAVVVLSGDIMVRGGLDRHRVAVLEPGQGSNDPWHVVVARPPATAFQFGALVAPERWTEPYDIVRVHNIVVVLPDCHDETRSFTNLRMLRVSYPEDPGFWKTLDNFFNARRILRQSFAVMTDLPRMMGE